MISIIQANGNADVKRFINFPHDLYADDPYYVPELYQTVAEVLSKKKNPFFQHSEAQLFLAIDNNSKIVGRISASLDNNYNKHHNSNVGFFGFFDVIDDYSVASKLLDTAVEWLKDKKVERVLGPANFTTNDTAGMLTDGYNDPPVLMMTYNKPYYNDFVTKYGFDKEMDLFAYFIPTQGVNEKALRLAGMLQQRLQKSGITFRNANKKTIKKDILRVKEVYRQAWEENWGFVPPTDAEFDHLAQGLMMILDYNYVYLAEDKGKLVGFAVALPDINQITKDFKKGKLFPFNVFKLLFQKSKISRIRIILLGVIDDYRQKGIEAVFFAKYIQAAKEKNLLGGEASWILENNEMMVKAAENLNGKRYKTYRIYGKDI